MNPRNAPTAFQENGITGESKISRFNFLLKSPPKKSLNILIVNYLGDHPESTSRDVARRFNLSTQEAAHIIRGLVLQDFVIKDSTANHGRLASYRLKTNVAVSHSGEIMVLEVC